MTHIIWATDRFQAKTHPIVNFRILAHETGRFLENSSEREHYKIIIFYKNWTGPHKKLMDEFSRNRSSSCPEIENSKKDWMSLPEISLWHAPENWNFGKFLDEFSRISTVVISVWTCVFLISFRFVKLKYSRVSFV